MARKLTARQERFVAEYLIDLNATQAAIRAGYSQKRASEMAYQLLQKPTVQAAVEQAKKAQAKRIQITADDVLRDLVEIKNRCMQAMPVLDREGKETGMWVFDAKDANKRLELIGKHLGMFVEKKEITGKDGGPLVAGGVLVVPEVDAADAWLKRAEETVIEQKIVKAKYTGGGDG